MKTPTVENFIGTAKYDSMGQKIWGINKKGGHQMIADLRGWGDIQNLFMDSSGAVDFEKAAEFQDAMGEWIVDAINKKLNENVIEVPLEGDILESSGHITDASEPLESDTHDGIPLNFPDK